MSFNSRTGNEIHSLASACRRNFEYNIKIEFRTAMSVPYPQGTS